MRQFCDMTPEEIQQLIYACEDAAVKYTNTIGIGALSISGLHDLYRALGDAIEGEWKLSNSKMRGKRDEHPTKKETA